MSGKDPIRIKRLLQEDINSLSKWCKLNKMTINVDKTKVLWSYSERGIPDLTDMDITLDRHPLQRVPVFNYLGVLIDTPLTLDDYPLHRAAQQRQEDVLRRLISAGESVNTGTFDYVTPLHNACLAGHVTCVRILVEAGALINVRNIDGITPLCDAATSGSIECVRILMQHGAELNPELCLTTPLHEAVMGNHVEVIDLLVQAGARLNASDLHYGTPLHLAAFKNHVHAAAALLRGGANVNAVKTHQTPLHIAARNHNEALVALLLDHGADVHARNNWGKTARDLGERSEEVSSLLTFWERNPPSLVQLCRLTVRRAVGPARLKDVHQLGLPSPAATFLQYLNWQPLTDTWRTNCTIHMACI